jgi:Fuc2NAc and GlcNAc transferase
MIYPAIGTGLLSCLVTYLLSHLLIRHNVIDVPGERSSHQHEKPRGGGIAFVLGINALLYIAWSRGIIDVSMLAALAIPGLMIAVVGFVDDVRSLSLKPRLITQFVATVIALYLIPLPEIQFGEYRLSLSYLLLPLYFVATVWFINLYNFMDGIDGIASVEAISILLSASLILAAGQPDSWASLLLALTAPIVGFVIWNLPRSIIFMGDVGSGHLGFMLAALALATASLTSLNIWTWVILGTAFIADATYTLIHRFRSGQNWTQPHRSHGYQVLARRLNSHVRVNLILVGVNLVYLLPLAWFATRSPELAWILAIVAYFPFLIGYRKLGAGNSSIAPGNS